MNTTSDYNQYAAAVASVASCNEISNGMENFNANQAYLMAQQNLQFAPGQTVQPNSAKRAAPGNGGDSDGGVKERRKIKIEYVKDKSRRHITFSKRKAGIMKKAYELSTLTGTQVLLLVVSETGLVYTFTTPKLQPIVTRPDGKRLIQSCLNNSNAQAFMPDPQPHYNMYSDLAGYERHLQNSSQSGSPSMANGFMPNYGGYPSFGNDLALDSSLVSAPFAVPNFPYNKVLPSSECWGKSDQPLSQSPPDFNNTESS